jgi:hypothetical protein
MMLADAIVIVHLCLVLFVLTGVPLIYLGAARHWAWVRSRRWRLLHLIAIAVIAAESLFGIVCPLTVWEDRLRGKQISTGFIERWIDRILFYDAPPGCLPPPTLPSPRWSLSRGSRCHRVEPRASDDIRERKCHEHAYNAETNINIIKYLCA